MKILKISILAASMIVAGTIAVYAGQNAKTASETPAIIIQTEKIPEVTEETEDIYKDFVYIPDTMSEENQKYLWTLCKENNIDFAFVMALISCESSFRESVISKTNDYGLMQINRSNHKRLKEELGITDFLDAEQNMQAGMYMLRELFEAYEEPHLVLMAYNMGDDTAKKLWKKGIYSSKYSRAVMAKQEEYNAYIEGVNTNE